MRLIMLVVLVPIILYYLGASGAGAKRVMQTEYLWHAWADFVPYGCGIRLDSFLVEFYRLVRYLAAIA